MNYKKESNIATDEKRKKENDDNAKLNQKEKINTLLNTETTNEEKSIIYENYIKSKTKDDGLDEFEVIKATKMDMKEYLNYKMQEFESDREDDGTLKGKTKSGSKRNKLVKYLNENIKKEIMYYYYMQ